MSNLPKPGSKTEHYQRYLAGDGSWVDGLGETPVSAIRYTTTYDPPSLATGSSTKSANITVPGAVIGDFVLVSAPYDLQGAVATAYVSAADTVVINLANLTGATIDLASGAWKVRVIKY